MRHEEAVCLVLRQTIGGGIMVLFVIVVLRMLYQRRSGAGPGGYELLGLAQHDGCKSFRLR